jgi:hypothetical protein
LKWITDQPAWKRSEGRDHIVPVHHPWSFKSVRKFVKKAIWLLPDMDSTGNWYDISLFATWSQSCLCTSVEQYNSHFSPYIRYKPGQVYLEKDVILPYVPNVDFCDYKCVSETQSKRNTLLFFRGRLKRNAVSFLVLLPAFDNIRVIYVCDSSTCRRICFLIFLFC